MTYRHINLDITENNNDWQAVGVNGKPLFTASTENQVQKWIEQEWKLSQQRIDAYGLQASYIGNDIWNISQDGWIIATAKVKTTREKRDDYSGLKKYKIITRSEITLTLRVYQQDIELDTPFMEWGRSPMHRFLKQVAHESLWVHARLSLETQCTKAGASTLQILDCFDSNEKRHCANLAQLLERLTTN